MEYDSFVKNLAKDSPHSARCLPETRYSHEFEQRMEALVLNFDIEGTSSSGQDMEHYCNASANEAQWVSSFDIPTGCDSQDGMLYEGESLIEPKLGEILDSQYLSDSLSGIEQCLKVDEMIIGEEYPRKLREENKDVESSILNKSLYDTGLTIPAKRTYDQTNEAVDDIRIIDASLSKSMKMIATSTLNDHDFGQSQNIQEYGELRLPRQ
ncbi:uncharacterized protein LOC131216821 [Anopheles bellator]|uniref:uncharacterized protein LOC131216821 n=1 Tax=Anopheles bellator TaxID=139047 RepID=UPI0026492616|nr:uncharacterized protein LOC131216821 [Anopheles bellator]